MTGTRFAPGPGTAYVTDHAIVLTPEGDVDPGVIARCSTAEDWPTLLGATADLASAAVVHQDGPRRSPGDRRLSVAAVGGVRAVVETADGESLVVGEGSREVRSFDGAVAVRLELAAAHDAGGTGEVYCVDGGAVPASTVSRRLVAAGTGALDAFDALFGHTVARSVEQAAVRDDAPPSRPALGLLVFSTGARVVLDRSMVLGRNPRQDGESPIDDVRLVRIASAGVSRRHAAITVDRWRASIDDLGSSNGTVVRLPDRSPVVLEPGRPVDLSSGAHVDLGGEVSFTVEETA